MMLLTDGIHKNWESSACSNRKTSNGNYENQNQGKFSINHLKNPRVGCIENETVQANDCNLDECEVNSTRISRKMPIDVFRQN